MLNNFQIRVAFLVAFSVSSISALFIWLHHNSYTHFEGGFFVFSLLNFIINFIFIYILLNRYFLKKESNKKEIAELKANERYRKEFLGNVSHELKTPIFNMQGYILTLLDGGLEDPEINKKYLQRTEQNINRMISVVEDLETISKLEAHELKLSYSSFNIIKLIKEVIEMLEIRASENQIKLKFDTDKKEIFVRADKDRITEVLMNLVANSIRYGKAHGRTKIQLIENRYSVRIDVIDNGIGIESKHLKRIFERFYRVDKSRSKKLGGTGLGLSIVKHIIDAHGQAITVKSTPNIGTSFTFTLDKSKQKHSNKSSNR